jgi:hypothetical protein
VGIILAHLSVGIETVKNAGTEVRCVIHDTGYEMRDMRYRMPDMGYEIKVGLGIRNLEMKI